MARTKRNFLKQSADNRLVARHYLMQGLILLMFLIVLYDSFVYQIPFYYICFLLSGLIVGRMVAITDRVKHRPHQGDFTIETSPYSLVVTLLLLSVRFLWGRYLLESFNVLWATDALYLVFIGIFAARRRSLVKQMDELVYGWLSSKHSDSTSIHSGDKNGVSGEHKDSSDTTRQSENET